MKKSGISLVFWLFTALLFISAYGYTIFTDGMFFDGVFYAAIANNLANGMGTFWEMQYTTTLHASFHEQPPLGSVLIDSCYKQIPLPLQKFALYKCE